MSNDSTTYDPESIRNMIPEEPEPTADEMRDAEEGGSFELLPEGDYLVRIFEVGADVRHTDRESYPQLVLKMKVVEPSEFEGRIIWERVRMYAVGEPEWARNKRIAMLRKLDLVPQNDPRSFSRFDWPSLKGLVAVYGLEHRTYEDKQGKQRTATQAANFCTLLHESAWDDARPAQADDSGRRDISTRGSKGTSSNGR